jgi:hypothetical protein
MVIVIEELMFLQETREYFIFMLDKLIPEEKIKRKTIVLIDLNLS